jgi:prepilin-type processing-associated H-X9-DG protein
MIDWDDHYPTNRLISSKKPLDLQPEIPLSDDCNSSVIFQYGINWVEALYPYIEKVGNPGDNSSVWYCYNARPSNDKNSHNTYAINFNLLEKSDRSILFSSNLMLVREMDRACGAVCRPMNISKDSKTPPIGAFLTDSDPVLGRCNKKLHSSRGSHVLFADGHVKLISTDLMPEVMTKEKNWDSTTKQWWNEVSGPENMIITVSP